MSRRKHGFRDFRLKELDGGLNVRDSANEIEDKQFIKCTNFNFKGNKLVNTKSMKEIFRSEGASTGIKGLLKDGTDIWYVHDAKIFKNGVRQDTSGSIPDRTFNMTFWNDILFLTSNEKDGTVDDAVFILQGNSISSLVIADTGRPRYNTVYNGKLILGGYDETPSAVLHSKTASVTDPELLFDFSGYNAGSALVGDSSMVTGFMVTEQGLNVFKQNEVWFSNTEKDTGTTFDFIFRKITTTGGLSQEVIVEVEQEVFYYDHITRNVRRLGYEKNLTTLRDVSISREIEPLLEALPEDQPVATASFKYPNYKLFLRSDLSGDNVNDICFTYNVDRKSWLIEDNKITGIADKGILGSPFEGVIFDDDEGAGSKGEVISKEFDFGDAIDFERFGELEIAGKLDDTVTLFVDIYVGRVLKETRTVTTQGQATGTLGTNVLGATVLGGDNATTGLVPFAERFNLYLDGQNMNYGIRYEGLGQVEIHDINIQHKRLKGFKNYA